MVAQVDTTHQRIVFVHDDVVNNPVVQPFVAHSLLTDHCPLVVEEMPFHQPLQRLPNRLRLRELCLVSVCASLRHECLWVGVGVDSSDKRTNAESGQERSRRSSDEDLMR